MSLNILKPDPNDISKYLVQKTKPYIFGAKTDTLTNIPQWNQLYPKSGVFVSGANKGITLTNNGDGSYTLNGSVTEGASYAQFVKYDTFSLTANHKYYVHFLDEHTGMTGGDANGYFHQYDGIIRPTKTFASVIYIRVYPDAGTLTNYTVYCQLFDLTEIFGAGNEPTTVEEFDALFSKDYYAYKTATANYDGEIKYLYDSIDTTDETYRYKWLQPVGLNLLSGSAVPYNILKI